MSGWWVSRTQEGQEVGASGPHRILLHSSSGQVVDSVVFCVTCHTRFRRAHATQAQAIQGEMCIIHHTTGRDIDSGIKSESASQVVGRCVCVVLCWSWLSLMRFANFCACDVSVQPRDDHDIDCCPACARSVVLSQCHETQTHADRLKEAKVHNHSTVRALGLALQTPCQS